MLSLIVLAALWAGPQVNDYEKGVALFEQGNRLAAIPLLANATRAHPDDARAWKALGVAHAAGGEYDEAEPAFERACRLAPKLLDACYYHGRALYALNRFEASLAALDLANDNHWKVQFARAQTLEGLSRPAEAESEFRRAVKACRGDNPEPGAGLGRFLVRQGRFDDAVSPLTEVLKVFPKSAEAHTQLGRALLELGRLADAAPHLETAALLAPASAQAHLLLARIYVRMGRAAEAQPHFEAAARAEAAAQGVR